MLPDKPPEQWQPGARDGQVLQNGNSSPEPVRQRESSVGFEPRDLAGFQIAELHFRINRVAFNARHLRIGAAIRLLKIGGSHKVELETQGLTGGIKYGSHLKPVSGRERVDFRLLLVGLLLQSPDYAKRPPD